MKNSMTFKTIFSDINKVAVARDSLSGIRFDSKNVAVVEAYKNAIKGLNEEQARYVLSKRYVSEADQADLLTKAEIIAANDGVKASELSRQLVLQGVRKEQAEALIEQVSGNEAITSNTVLTKEQTTAILEQAEARKFLSAQQRKNIADDIEETASSAQEASAEMAQASADVAESGTKMGSASSILARSVSQLGVGFKSLLSIFVSNPVAVIATLTGSVIGLTYVIGKFQDTAKNAAKTASEFSSSMSSANSTYNKESDSLNDLTEKYEDLREQLISAKGDEEKTYDIKSQLLELQEQLNDIYGDECEKVNLVTDAYKDQTSELKKNAKQKADNYLNTHVDEINEATKKMTTNYEYELGNFNYGLQDASVGNELHEQIKKLAEKSGIEWDDNKGFVFKGIAEEASKAIDQFMTDVRKLRDSEDGLSDGIINNLKAFDSSMSDQLGVANEIIDGYQETYETAQMAQIASDKDLSQGYNEAVSAVEAYNDAVSKSDNPYDDENVKEAWNNLQTVKSGIQSNEDEWGQYSNIMDKVFSSASDDVYSFYQAIQNDDSIKSLTNDFQGLTDIDLQSMANDDTEDSFDKLCKAAKKYGLEVQDVIDLLIQLGIVQGKVQEQNSNETPISFTDALNSSEYKDVKEKLLDLANAGQLTGNALEGLAGGQQLMNETGLSAEALAQKINGLVNASTQLSSMSAQISKMSDMLADKKNGTVASASDLAGFDVSVRGLESWDKFEEVIGSSESSMDQCQKAANALATEWVNSENFLANLTDANKQYYITQLDQMGVENASAVVEQALANKRAEEAAQTEYNTTATEYNTKAKTENEKVTTDLIDATPKEVAEILAEASASKAAKKSIAELYLSKLDINNTKINTKDDVKNIVAIAKAAGVSKQYISQLQSALDKLVNGNTYSNGTKFSDLQFGMTSGKIDYSSGLPTIDELKKKGTQQQAKKSAEDIVKQINDSFTEIKMPDIKIKPTGSSSYKSPSSKKSKSKSKTKSDAAEVFDFIEIKLNNLADKASKAKDKIDDLLTFGQKKNQTKKAIEATTKAITAQEKAYKKYMSYANKAAKTQNSKKTTSSSSSSSGGNALYDTATNYLGLKYVWGGASLTSGADCSGFTQQIYKKFGVSLPHHAADQAKMGTKITSKKNLQAGDLVFFGSKNNITHVGIYGGDGKFIESPHTGASVRVSKLSSRKDFVSGSRFSGISGSTTTSGRNVKKVKGVSSKTLEHYKKLIREGTLGSDGIASIKNENLKNALKDYQTWYEKAKACKEQVASLTDQLKDLYETLANNPIDSASDKIEKLGIKMDILNAKVGNLTFNPTKKIGTSDIDSLYKQIIKNYNSQLSASKTAYTGATKSYKFNKSSLTKSLRKTKAKNIGLTQKEFNSIKSNLKSNKSISNNLINKIENDTLRKKCIAHNEYLLAKNTATDNYNQAKEDHTSNVRQARKDRFDKVQARYDNKAGLIEQRKNAVSNSLSIAEAKGQLIGEAYYTRQANAVKSDMKLKQEEAGKLAKKLSTIKFGSDEWYEAQEALNGVYESIQQDEQELAEFQKSINELKFDRFDELINKLGDITDETDFLIDMLDSDNLFDSDTGMITQDGITAMGLTAQNYDVYLAEAEEYKQMLSDVKDMYDDGTISLGEYEEYQRKYSQSQRDAIKNANEAKKSLVAYVKQGLDAQNDALEKAISKKRELLETDKSLKEWNDKLADSNKNIAKLEKQIAALEGDDSEENRKKLQQLKSDLQDAQKDQSDMLYDHSVSDQEKALDDMLTKSKESAESYLKDTNKVFSDALTYVNANSSQVASNIEKIAKDTGYDVSTYIVNAWKDGGNAVGDYASTLSSNIPNITAQLSLIASSWQSICDAADRAAEASAKYAETKVTDTQGIGSPNDSGTSGNGSGSSGSNDDDKQQELNKLRKKASDITEWISKHSVSATHKKSYYGALNQYLYDKQHGQVLSEANEVALAKKLGVSVKSDLSGKNDREKITSALKKLIKDASFSTGGVIKDLVKLSGEDGISFLQRGEAVLSKEQTQALLNFKPVIPQIDSIIGNLKNIPIEKVSSQSPTYQIDNRTIVEGVATDQIVKQMKGVAQKQAENVVRKINQVTYAKGVRR